MNATVPTMPVPRALESLVGLVHPPDADAPEVPIRHVLAAIANAVGGQLDAYLVAAVTARINSPTFLARSDAAAVIEAIGEATRALDDALDALDVIWTPTDDDVGDVIT